MELFGWIANLLYLVGGGIKTPRKTMIYYISADTLYISLYVFLDLYLAALALFICAFRTCLALFIADKWNFYSLIILTSIACLLIAIKMETNYDLLLLFGTIAIGLSCHCRDDFVKFKILGTL